MAEFGMPNISHQLSTSEIYFEQQLGIDGGIMSEYQRLKRFGASEEEMKIWSALQRLGLTQEEMELGKSISNSYPCDVGCAHSSKVEKVTGHSETEIKRAKALIKLGAREQDFDESRAKRLGSIGMKEEN